MDTKLCKSCTTEIFKTHESSGRQYVRRFKQEARQTNTRREGIVSPEPLDEKEVVKEKTMPRAAVQKEKVKIKFGGVVVYVTNSKKLKVKEDGDFLELRMQK
ncbi:MAG: hypothetical protein FWE45_01955 [Firmicutes bacterium]|nr:hypothetical protein [Bacillota bacterium]